VNVYVVTFGERGEGRSPIEVFTGLRQAKAYVLQKFRIQMGNQATDGVWRGSLNWIDEVEIIRFKLKGHPS
jgi:hypothetical protein